MAYQRKKLPQEEIRKSPAPTAQNNLFAPPDMELDEDENSLSGYISKDAPSLEMRRQMAKQSSYDFGSIPLFAKASTIQRQPRLPLQAKLTVGAANDKYEQEADRVASQVMTTINSPKADSPVQRESREKEEESLQMKSDEAGGQGQWARSQISDLQMKSTLQQVGYAGGEVTQDLESEIQRAKGGGEVLAPDLQRRMGQAMGADFSGVRVHTDAKSDQLHQTIQAQAFTTGQDVFFRKGEYNPGKAGGQELIAHELTHVMQQSGARIRRKNDSHAGISTTNVNHIQRDFWNIQISDIGDLFKFHERVVPYAGGEFRLVSRRGQRISNEIEAKFQVAMNDARAILNDTITYLSGDQWQNSDRAKIALRYCFPYGDNDNVGQVVERVRANYQKMAVGLDEARIPLVDVSKAFARAAAGNTQEQGYVNVRKTEKGEDYNNPEVPLSAPLGGRIHVAFSMAAESAADLIIHEASHKFCGTKDNGYMRTGVTSTVDASIALLAMKGEDIPKTIAKATSSPLASFGAGLNNADSYAGFARYFFMNLR